MKHQQWGQFALASPPKRGPDEVPYGVLRQPGRGLDVREILPPPVEGKECLLTSPSIGLLTVTNARRRPADPPDVSPTDSIKALNNLKDASAFCAISLRGSSASLPPLGASGVTTSDSKHPRHALKLAM